MKKIILFVLILFLAGCSQFQENPNIDNSFELRAFEFQTNIKLNADVYFVDNDIEYYIGKTPFQFPYSDCSPPFHFHVYEINHVMSNITYFEKSDIVIIMEKL
jgi:hypothetical protein